MDIATRKITFRLEQLGFPANDTLSTQKVQKVQKQLVELGFNPSVALNVVLSSFASIENTERRDEVIRIFCQSSITGPLFDIQNKIKEMNISLKEFGFREEEFLKALSSHSALLAVGVDKLEKRVREIDRKYGAYGFSGKDFLKSGYKEPCLLGYDSKTLSEKIETLYDAFSPLGIRKEEVCFAVKKQPNLLSVKPELVIQKANLLLLHHSKGFWSIEGDREETPTKALRFILLTRPMALNLSEKNIKSRKVYALTQPELRTLRLGTSLRGRRDMQRKVEDVLMVQKRYRLIDHLYKSGYFDERYRKN